MKKMNIDKIIVLDFGSQYNQLIVRNIRELGVYSELKPFNTEIKELQDASIKGIILSGGPHSVYDLDSFSASTEIFNLGIPVLGICYGMQWISQVFGGKIEVANMKEYGKQEIVIFKSSPLLANLPKKQIVWMSHGDYVRELPDGFTCLASSQNTNNAIMACEEKRIYGVQFHPEVKHSEYGKEILKNFILNICHMQASWNMENFIEYKFQEIREIVKEEKVLMAISGGVDSSVAAVLINKAIGNNLKCVFIDHGLLRKNEANEVMERFQKQYQIDVLKVDAKERFLKKLQGITSPEEKRKIIGHEFIALFEKTALQFSGEYTFLGQGTLYTDIIESGTKTAKTIKSHHNVGGLPKDMKFKLLEPLNLLFKDEVRKLGLVLGIHEDLVNRQPFPGPGLAVRILGEITAEKLQIVRESDAILREEIARAKLNEQIWQYFTVLPNIKTVGVMGDNRTYDHTVAIRAITSQDGLTADWARIPYDVLDIISRRIVNEVKGCNRVVLDITSKPPATIEWE